MWVQRAQCFSISDSGFSLDCHVSPSPDSGFSLDCDVSSSQGPSLKTVCQKLKTKNMLHSSLKTLHDEVVVTSNWSKWNICAVYWGKLSLLE